MLKNLKAITCDFKVSTARLCSLRVRHDPIIRMSCHKFRVSNLVNLTYTTAGPVAVGLRDP